MIATIWRFRVHAGRATEFERVYGPAGDWAALLARAPGFAGTELLRVDAESGSYFTIDRWLSTEHYDAAKRALEAEYAALDRRCEAYTSEETWLGLCAILP